MGVNHSALCLTTLRRVSVTKSTLKPLFCCPLLWVYTIVQFKCKHELYSWNVYTYFIKTTKWNTVIPHPISNSAVLTFPIPYTTALFYVRIDNWWKIKGEPGKEITTIQDTEILLQEQPRTWIWCACNRALRWPFCWLWVTFNHHLHIRLEFDPTRKFRQANIQS